MDKRIETLIKRSSLLTEQLKIGTVKPKLKWEYLGNYYVFFFLLHI